MKQIWNTVSETATELGHPGDYLVKLQLFTKMKVLSLAQTVPDLKLLLMRCLLMDFVKKNKMLFPKFYWFFIKSSVSSSLISSNSAKMLGSYWISFCLIVKLSASLEFHRLFEFYILELTRSAPRRSL